MVLSTSIKEQKDASINISVTFGEPQRGLTNYVYIRLGLGEKGRGYWNISFTHPNNRSWAYPASYIGETLGFAIRRIVETHVES